MGGLPGIIVPWKRHGALGHDCMPIALNEDKIQLNQCRGDCPRPYNVLSSFQYGPCFDTGQPDGGLTMTTSSLGKTP
eukprot:163917-Ditylum_brightwellii.AAC.1